MEGLWRNIDFELPDHRMAYFQKADILKNRQTVLKIVLRHFQIQNGHPEPVLPTGRQDIHRYNYNQDHDHEKDLQKDSEIHKQ